MTMRLFRMKVMETISLIDFLGNSLLFVRNLEEYLRMRDIKHF